ncbi:MAG: 50S ribosomal protein L37e [Candidatus Altiarchaeota archaeon]|nr:50S ribosomal protein L37e [Candidatus Altiarchaeota archaeon]
MSKGTPSFGKRQGKTVHGVCRRCGSSSYNLRTGTCGSCGFGIRRRLNKHGWTNRK